MKKVFIVVVIIIGVAVAWWLGSPLFLDKEVNEAIPVALDNNDEEGNQSTDNVTWIEGTFVGYDAAHSGSGRALILENDTSTLLRLEDFSVTNGPDLRVVLVENSEEPFGTMIDLGELKGNQGNQNYEIPSTVDLSQVGGVMIYCRAFSVPFAVAKL